MRTQRALLSTAWLILGLLLTAGEPPSERIVSKYSTTARAKSISFQETGEEGDPGFHGLFPGFGGYRLKFLGGDERTWINIKFGKQTVDLYRATMDAAAGTFPHKANDVVEWRGGEKRPLHALCNYLPNRSWQRRNTENAHPSYRDQA
jgi:hypothetical protein